jgi:hypothetical protein
MIREGEAMFVDQTVGACRARAIAPPRHSASLSIAQIENDFASPRNSSTATAVLLFDSQIVLSDFCHHGLEPTRDRVLDEKSFLWTKIKRSATVVGRLTLSATRDEGSRQTAQGNIAYTDYVWGA